MIAILAALAAVTAPAPTAAPAAASSAAAAAVDSDRRAAARRLIEASGFRARQLALARSSWNAALAERLSDCLDQAATGKHIDCASTPAQSARTKAMLAAEQDRTFDSMGEAAETIYAEHFTAAEMDQLAAFFQSDIGRKYGQAYPAILAAFETVKGHILRDAIDAAHAQIAGGAGGKP